MSRPLSAAGRTQPERASVTVPIVSMLTANGFVMLHVVVFETSIVEPSRVTALVTTPELPS